MSPSEFRIINLPCALFRCMYGTSRTEIVIYVLWFNGLSMWMTMKMWNLSCCKWLCKSNKPIQTGMWNWNEHESLSLNKGKTCPLILLTGKRKNLYALLLWQNIHHKQPFLYRHDTSPQNKMILFLFWKMTYLYINHSFNNIKITWW